MVENVCVDEMVWFAFKAFIEIETYGLTGYGLDLNWIPKSGFSRIGFSRVDSQGWIFKNWIIEGRFSRMDFQEWILKDWILENSRIGPYWTLLVPIGPIGPCRPLLDSVVSDPIGPLSAPIGSIGPIGHRIGIGRLEDRVGRSVGNGRSVGRAESGGWSG